MYFTFILLPLLSFLMLPALASLFSGCTSFCAMLLHLLFLQLETLFLQVKKGLLPNSSGFCSKFIFSVRSPLTILLNIKINFFAYASCSLPCFIGYFLPSDRSYFFVFTIYLTPSPKNASFLRAENFVYFDHCCGLSD